LKDTSSNDAIRTESLVPEPTSRARERGDDVLPINHETTSIDLLSSFFPSFRSGTRVNHCSDNIFESCEGNTEECDEYWELEDTSMTEEGIDQTAGEGVSLGVCEGEGNTYEMAMFSDFALW